MGYIYLTDPNGGKKGFRVEMCIRKKLDSIHLVRVSEADEALWEQISKAAEGTEVDIEVDWERRVDQVSLMMNGWDRLSGEAEIR